MNSPTPIPALTTDTRAYLAAIGARGGAATTPRKRAAVRRNGRKGGRPRKER